MIIASRFTTKIKGFWKKILENPLFWKKMNVNEAPDGDQCKRPNDDEGDTQKHKKLCTDDVVPASGQKLRKKKFAILLGYNGGKYRGMQINKDTETVELHLHKALYDAGLISESEFQEIHLIKFQRAARTDKGVSAARQVVSLVMYACSCEKINAFLPADIRVFSARRVTKNFDSKGNCDARTYSYLLPTQALSTEPMSKFLEMDYRISPDSLQEVNDILSTYCGTHSFHNFTHKRLFGDPSCKRYIMSFTCGKPFVKGKEFVLLTVKGQSFMLHQIRKMVGAMIAIRRGLAAPDIIKTAFRGEDWHIPIAPGEGLFLEKPHFDKYDRRFGNDGIHQSLSWEDVEDEVMKFREESIISEIIRKELENKVMADWIENHLFPIERSTRGEGRPQNTNRNIALEEKTVLAL